MERISHELKVKKVLSRYGVRFAYLFGSRATGKGKIAASDYDVAVFFGIGTPSSRFETRLKLMGKLQEICAPVRTDLVILDDTRSATFRYEIANTGHLIYEKDAESRIEFEFRAMHEYEDFAPFLTAYNKMYIGSAV